MFVDVILLPLKFSLMLMVSVSPLHPFTKTWQISICKEQLEEAVGGKIDANPRIDFTDKTLPGAFVQLAGFIESWQSHNGLIPSTTDV